MKATRSSLFTLILINIWIVNACAQAKPIQENSRQLVTFSNDDFEIAFGPNWKRRDNEESFEWEDEENMQEILISVLAARESMDPELMLTTATKLMQHRRKAIADISEGKAKLTEVETFQTDDAVELVVRGVDNSYGMQIYTSVIVRPTRAVTFAYYKYSPLMPKEAFVEKSEALRSALKVY